MSGRESLSESDIKDIALFFFFTMLDEKRAILAAAQTYEQCSKKIERDSSLSIGETIVSSSYKIWNQHKAKLIRGRPQYSLSSGWNLPSGIDIGVWKDFQKNATEEDLLALVWSKILNISDIEIAHGLGLTIGTVRYRVSHAVRKLNAFQLSQIAVSPE